MVNDSKGSRARVLADMATLGMSGELRKVKRYRVVGSAPPVSAETQAANAREAKVMAGKAGKGRGKVKPAKVKPGKVKPTLTEKAEAEHTRDRPTRERLAVGVFERADMGRIDAARLGDKALLDWKARAGGAGEMFLRGQIKRREADAAAELMELLETSQASGMSMSEVRERVDGGKVDTDGARLAAAVKAWRGYQAALACLGKWGRFLVEQRIVANVPMETVAASPVLADALGNGSLKFRCQQAMPVLRAALDQLADHFRLPGA